MFCVFLKLFCGRHYFDHRTEFGPPNERKILYAAYPKIGLTLRSSAAGSCVILRESFSMATPRRFE
jgi:hypothetical protein